MRTIEKEIHYSWTITLRGGNLQRTNQSILSPYFPFNTTYNNGVSWHLELHLKSSSVGNVGIYLRKNWGTISDASCIFTFLKSDNTEIIKEVIICDSIKNKQEWGLRKLIEQVDLCDEIKGYHFTILCNIIYTQECEMIEHLENPTCGCLHNLGLLLENKEFCDVTLSDGKNNIGAHRAILAARSPIFKAMFTHDMAEKQHNKVEITDIRSDVLKDMLRFIYTGTVPEENLTTGLLVAADKYELEKLKLMCANALCRKLSLVNVCKIFIIADRHSVNCLKMEAENFIINNAKVLITTQEWDTMSADHPHLVKEAFRALVNRAQCRCKCK